MFSSNGCKFTPPGRFNTFFRSETYVGTGGKLIVSTRLIEPVSEDLFRSISPGPSDSGYPLSCSHLSLHNQMVEPPHQLTRIIVRIEVTDVSFILFPAQPKSNCLCRPVVVSGPKTCLELEVV